jgi:voltage-gated potassium channel Kch
MASAALSPLEGDWHGAPPPQSAAAASSAPAPAPPASAARPPPPPPPPVPRPIKVVTARAPPPESLRTRVWRTMEDPTYSPLAKLVALVIVVSIALSTVAFVVQTLPQYVFSPDTVWMGIEVTTISIFTVEFAVRLWATPSYKAFFRSGMNWIDIMAIAPFYVELALGGSDAAASAGVLRVARLIRIFRVFKVSRYLPWMRVFGRALLLSLQPLLMLVFVVLIGVVVFASAMYYAERGEWDAALATYVRVGEDGVASPSPFRSIPDSMWWAIVTMTTVGYGDTFPVTGPGRFIASVAALCGASCCRGGRRCGGGRKGAIISHSWAAQNVSVASHPSTPALPQPLPTPQRPPPIPQASWWWPSPSPSSPPTSTTSTAPCWRRALPPRRGWGCCAASSASTARGWRRCWRRWTSWWRATLTSSVPRWTRCLRLRARSWLRRSVRWYAWRTSAAGSCTWRRWRRVACSCPTRRRHRRRQTTAAAAVAAGQQPQRRRQRRRPVTVAAACGSAPSAPAAAAVAPHLTPRPTGGDSPRAVPCTVIVGGSLLCHDALQTVGSSTERATGNLRASGLGKKGLPPFTLHT